MGKIENIADDFIDVLKWGLTVVGFYAIGTILVKVMEKIAAL